MSNTGITVDDLKTQLRAVQDAILASLKTAASLNRPGLGYTRVAFSELRQREKELVLAINRADGGLIAVLDVSGIGGSSDTEWDDA
jgi:hypothetical protein